MIDQFKRGWKRQYIITFLLVFFLVFTRYCYFGFEYYHQLDDYTQYYNYNARGVTSIIDCINIGLLAARPFAGIGDVMVWSNLFSNMIVAVGIISAMYALSACLYQRVWARHFGTGLVFIALYSFLPLGIEGLYWVSASSRIVLGIFFASIALYLFEKWCTDGKKYHLLLYIIVQLISYGFYEQTLVLSFAGVVLVAFLHIKEHRNRSLWALMSFVNLVLYFVITNFFAANAANDAYVYRSDVILPISKYYFMEFLPSVLLQFKQAFLGGGFYTLVKGFWRGVLTFISQPNFIYLICIIALCLLYFIKTRDQKNEGKKPLLAIIIGLAMALAPMAPFFIVSSSWFSLRGTVASFCGIALIIDAIVNMIVKDKKILKTATAVIVSVFILICSVASISEMKDYKDTTEKDNDIAQLLANKLEEDGYLDTGYNIGVLNVKSSFLENQNYYYHEHIHGVTESAWALADIVEYKLGGHRPTISPLPPEIMYKPWARGVRQLSLFDVFYFYNGDKIIDVTVTEIGENEYEINDMDGNRIAYSYEEDEFGYLILD